MSTQTLETTPPPDAAGTAREQAFEELARRHGPALYRMAYRLIGNAADAEDLMQDTLLEALRTFRRFRPGSRFDSWAFTIMRHRFIDRMRGRRRHPVVPLEAPEIAAALDTDSPPEEAAIQGELRRTIRHAVADLPAEFRTAVTLVDMEGLSYEEATRIMGCPVGTVRSRLHRGRTLLRRRLAPLLNGELSDRSRA